MPSKYVRSQQAGRMIDKFTRSRDWMQANFYDDLTRVFRQYNCVAPPLPTDTQADDARRRQMSVRGTGLFGPDNREITHDSTNGPNDEDSVINITMPDIWGLVRRKVARSSAKIVNLHYRDKSDEDRADRISTHMMQMWDRGRYHRPQKKHLTWGYLAGIGVKQWWWERETYESFQRVNVAGKKLSPETLLKIQTEYAEDIAFIQQKMMAHAMPGEVQAEMAASAQGDITQSTLIALAALKGKGTYLPLHDQSTGFVGAKFKNVPIYNFFPEPGFVSLREAAWIAVVEKKNKKWFRDLVKVYGDDFDPANVDGELGTVEYSDSGSDGDKVGYGLDVNMVNEILRDHPRGLAWDSSQDGNQLKKLLTDAIDRVDADDMSVNFRDEDDAEYPVLAIHYPGDMYCVEYLVGGRYYLGKVRYPWEFENRMTPHSDVVFIDSLLDGIGDSSARIISTLVDLRSSHMSYMNEAIHNVIRPLIFTDDPRVIDEPDLIKRKNGFRVVLMDGKFQHMQEGSALASINTVLNDEGSKMRAIQYATGESNMSMLANADPAQAATATGARILQGNQDVLSHEELEMLNAGLRDDVDIMFRLTKSELTEEEKYDRSPYRRAKSGSITLNAGGGVPVPGMEGQEGQGQPPTGPDWITVSPEDFQGDSLLDPEVGSTLADDDVTKADQALKLFDIAARLPQVFNLETARDKVLTAMGEGTRLNDWKAPPQPPPPPEKAVPQSTRKQMNLAMDLEKILARINDPEKASQIAATLLGEMMDDEKTPEEAPGGEGGGVSGGGEPSDEEMIAQLMQSGGQEFPPEAV